MKIRTLTLSSVVLAITLVLAGCSSGGMAGMDGSSPDPSSESAAMFNDADATFAMEMIAHHEQAIEMADIVLDNEGIDQRVVDLAFAIKDAQGPEIETMNQWLEDWGVAMGNSDMAGMGQSGMMSDEDMAALEAASGAEAARLFLEQMIEHHQGAIEMAQQELESGMNPDALALAQTIIDAQTAEIATMQDILASL